MKFTIGLRDIISYICEGQDILELHKKTMVSSGCALSLAPGTLWPEPVGGLNETSLGAVSKGNGASRRGWKVFGLVAWQYCRVCCRAGGHGRVSSCWRACHGPSGSEAGTMLGPGGRLLLLLAFLRPAWGQWLPWSDWSDCPGRAVKLVKQLEVNLSDINCSSVDIRLAVGQDFYERIRFGKLSLFTTLRSVFRHRMCIGPEACSGTPVGELEQESEECPCTPVLGSSSDTEDNDRSVVFGFCNSNPCRNGATCLENQEGFSCQCQLGFDGRTCEEDIDDCWPAPCQNGGTCRDEVASWIL